MVDRLYNFLVNRIPGIKEKYENKKKGLKGFRKINAWFYLVYLNLSYYVFRNKKIGESEKFPGYESKKLYSDASESSCSKLKSPELFAKELSKYDIISFDVFDTLIFRPFSSPTDLFFLIGNKLNYMDFKQIRIETERRAREIKYKEESHYEVNLEDIYSLISLETGISKEMAIEAELETECCLCFANQYMQRAVKELKRLHKKVIVTSDMYLNKNQIKTLLFKCGYDDFDNYYVSSDIKKSKSSGELFEYIQKQEGLNLSYAHVGDNYHSDFIQAKKHGFFAHHYPNVNEVGAAYRACDMSSITGGVYRGLVNVHLHNGLCEYTKEYEYGYIYGGIFVVGYCQMIHRYVTENKIDKILFLARDGDVLIKVYKMMYPDESDKCEYVYWSRLAAAKLGAKYFKYDYFRRFLYHKVNQGYTINQIMKSMELEDMTYDFCSSNKLSAQAKLTDKNVDILKGYLTQNWESVLDCYADQMEAGRQYYKEKLSGAKKAVAVDIGWAGSGAIVLDYVVNNIWNLNCSIVGIIAGTNTCHNAEPDATETFLQSGKLVSYLYSQRENRDIWKFHNPGKLHNLYWEMLLGSPAGSFKGFYLDSSNKYVCCCKPPQENSDRISQIHEGIMNFAKQYINLADKISPLEQISGRDAYAPMILVQSDENRDYIKSICEIMDEMNVV